MRKVNFKNRDWDIIGNLHFPENFDYKKKYPAIVCVHPGSSVKEQTAGLYAAQLAKNGFIALAFDASFQGDSGGKPRFLEDPATRVEDIRCAIDYLTTLLFVDNDRIGAMGVCAGGGYAANASISEKRIKAIVSVAGTNASRAFREASPIEVLKAVAQQRTAEAGGSEKLINNWIPDSAEDAKKSGLEEMDLLGAIDYYRTPRGQHPNSTNQLLFTSMSNLIMFDAFHLAEYFLTQPLLIIVGDKVGAFGSYRDGFELYNKAASANKKIHVVKGADHYDLYDKPNATNEALEQMVPFFLDNL
ncbi:alpha/beta hydrolase [Pedobacter psychroterrae]|uniref:Alpha/beta hydrolase n=1 Tax=Pedobacter psychroterrae TaxID=2530453 RepID=A0A4R0NSM7_9SPHI|nr:alpha/beta hydrolase [Pedobacter psychroterrae]TCD03139.1 alpha/beta hydrolase [Pedobacter psychroterrae]